MAHFDSWPNEYKERARVAIVRAVERGTPISFQWAVGPEQQAIGLIGVITRGGVTEVTFISPLKDVQTELEREPADRVFAVV